MWPIQQPWVSVDHVPATLHGLSIDVQELGVHLARIIAGEAVASGALRALDVMSGFGIADNTWLALLPADALAKALRLAVAPLQLPMKRTSTKGTIMNAIRNSPDTWRRPHHGRAWALGALVTLVALVVGLTLSVVPASVAATDGQREVSRAAAVTLKGHIDRADRALAKASKRVRAGRYHRAIKSLRRARLHTNRANTTARALIGAPPADPESDDPPGPPAVLAATKLDYRISTGTVALFNHHRKPRLVTALRRTLTAAQTGRDRILDVVIAQPEEGEGGDYADGMADTLGQYAREVSAISTAIKNFTLSPAGRTGLRNALARAQATQAKMTKAFGGGERAAH